jgi:hypothetical protein
MWQSRKSLRLHRFALRDAISWHFSDGPPGHGFLSHPIRVILIMSANRCRIHGFFDGNRK